MNKFKIPSYKGPINTIAMQNSIGVVVKDDSMQGPPLCGILIRWKNNYQAYIIWDDEESWETADGVSQFPSELCELEV